MILSNSKIGTLVSILNPLLKKWVVFSCYKNNIGLNFNIKRIFIAKKKTVKPTIIPLSCEKHWWNYTSIFLNKISIILCMLQAQHSIMVSKTMSWLIYLQSAGPHWVSYLAFLSLNFFFCNGNKSSACISSSSTHPLIQRAASYNLWAWFL